MAEIMSYRGKPVTRSKNEIYYGKMEDPFVIFIRVLTTVKDGEEDVADRVNVMLLSTDTTLDPVKRIVRQSDKNGLYGALDIGYIWLENALRGKV